MEDKFKLDLAATQLQSYIRGWKSRNKTNTYGKSEGKEIELYIRERSAATPPNQKSKIQIQKSSEAICLSRPHLRHPVEFHSSHR